MTISSGIFYFGGPNTRESVANDIDSFDTRNRDVVSRLPAEARAELAEAQEPWRTRQKKILRKIRIDGGIIYGGYEGQERTKTADIFNIAIVPDTSHAREFMVGEIKGVQGNMQYSQKGGCIFVNPAESDETIQKQVEAVLTDFAKVAAAERTLYDHGIEVPIEGTYNVQGWNTPTQVEAVLTDFAKVAAAERALYNHGIGVPIEGTYHVAGWNTRTSDGKESVRYELGRPRSQQAELQEPCRSLVAPQ